MGRVPGGDTGGSLAFRKEKLPPDLRIALWYVYNRRCAYTGEEIPGPEHVAIDHVLPERLAADEAELEKARQAFDLPSDFTVQRNTANYVPTTRPFNELKQDRTSRDEMVPRYGRAYLHHRPYRDYAHAEARTAEELIVHGLALAKQNCDAVNRLRSLIRLTDRVLSAKEAAPPDLAQVVFDRMIVAGQGTHPDQGGLEPPRSFPVRDSDQDERGYLSYSRAGASLSAYLPRLPEIAGTALVRFSEPGVSDALITLSHLDIITGLLPGFGTDPDEHVRPFLVGKYEGGWFVQLANVRAWVREEGIDEFCGIVDLLARRYITAAEDVERHVFRSTRFPYARRGYRLWRLPRHSWEAVMRFSQVHDYQAGSSTWNVFDATLTGFTVLGAPTDPNGTRTPVALFHAEVDTDVSGMPRSDVYVCWDPRPVHDLWFRVATRGLPGAWDAERAHDWFAQLLREVVRRAATASEDAPGSGFWRLTWLLRGRRSSGSREAASAAAWREHHLGWSERSAADLPQTAGAAFRSYGALKEKVRAMQRHFGSPYGTRWAHAESLRGVYRFLLWCVERSGRLGLARERIDGIAHALGKGYGSPASPLIADLAARLEGRTTANRGSLDLSLRAAVEVLMDPVDGEAEDALVDAATEHLGPLYDDYRLPAFLERLRSRPW